MATAAERLFFGAVSEADLDREVRRLAGLFGYRYYHTYCSQRSPAGFPDVVLLKAPRLIVAELKTQTGRLTRGRLARDQRGRPRWVTGQEEWLIDLAGCPQVEVYVWRPEDLGDIADILRDGPREELACVQRMAEFRRTR